MSKNLATDLAGIIGTRKRYSHRNLLAGLAIAASAVTAAPLMAAPPAATFQEGVSPTAGYDVEDADIRSGSPDSVIGGNQGWFIYSGTSREVVDFPISLPAGAVVTGA